MIVEHLGRLEATTPNRHNARFLIRDGTSDGSLVGGIVTEDEYGLAGRHFAGWAIDIGAHIGTVAVSLAIDNPDLRVVAVEALQANAEVLIANIVANGLQNRVFIENKAAGAEGEARVDITWNWQRAKNQPAAYMRDNRYIGGMVARNGSSETTSCPAISLGAICERFAIDEVALLKIDCEGCEWFVLTSPAIAKVATILGEFHAGRHGNRARLLELLGPTHEVRFLDDNEVVGHFEAVRR